MHEFFFTVRDGRSSPVWCKKCPLVYVGRFIFGFAVLNLTQQLQQVSEGNAAIGGENLE